ncbi:polysaccharide pyruvyl transferase CsaB [Gloeothece verrucosa]|uniref:Polysaccharide pyruvyl transferase CsaB n=1 Tax=Gloeothece verrucosa (strain PCC 7822) TaxID=497965 RepID=E0U6W9_GLOV7|nr:polysaccharide pyruvyl transferase CsaB [Gloeothece verrucosa]ADN16006.1 polysaccharide pyruvyl transferase CsaB [Gloeothece verrucosa PCC 7822]
MQALICGYYGKGNGGDEALLVSLLQMLPKKIKPIVLSNNPSQTRQRYGIETCPARSAFAILQAFQQSDIFIWGGGSLMQDVTSFASPFYYAALMGLAQQQGLKTVAWAQGIGPLKRPTTRWLTEQVLRGCTAVSVRDSQSATLVSQWDISPLIAPDPVWALESKPVQGLWDLPAPRVALNLRSHPQLTPQRLEVLTQALIDFQKATNAFILLVPFQASQDLAIARSISARLPQSHKIMTLDDPRELKGLFKGVEMTIGMRYHSLIMAGAEECRCFALSYDPKVSRLMQELNIPGWELAELPEDPNVISTAWLECYANGDALSSAQIHSLVDRALMHQELLKFVSDFETD